MLTLHKKELKSIKTDYIFEDELSHLLSALMPENRLACEVSLYTGLRISDVLNLKTEKLKRRMTIQEQKTGKNRSVYLSDELLQRLINNAGSIYAFPHRLDGRKHRTRQAVWKDLHHVSEVFRLPKDLVIAPHSCRKVYAVERFKKRGNIAEVKNLLNHSNEAVTVLYAMADTLTERKLRAHRVNYSVKEK